MSSLLSRGGAGRQERLDSPTIRARMRREEEEREEGQDQEEEHEE